MLGLTGVAAAHTLSPKITKIVPSSGSTAGGTLVDIKGNHLSSSGGVSTTVTFGSAPATDVIVKNPHLVEVTTPSSATAGAVNVVVTTNVGSYTDNDGFTYVTTPVIQSISPHQGPTQGEQVVTISGGNFNLATGVNFGSVAAVDWAINNDDNITAVTPAESAGTVTVTVTSSSGNSPSDPPTTNYTYEPNLPFVSSVAADVGAASNGDPCAGGSTVTVTGLGFNKGSESPIVDFGSGNPGSDVDVVNNTTLTVVPPAGSLGAVDVTVMTSNGTSNTNAPEDYYWYVASCGGGVS
ncbi:MAG TPA: IPT/TIG domain-containing protein [Acidimicrobiales bacterium]|nr:IPT/TIG domain-containing protein [Acidimicrobiales bacterium]